MNISIRRVYDPAQKDEGKRILVDRLWPRGISKEAAHIDLWLKEVAPSTELRKWFSHDPEKWEEFKKRYSLELAGNPAMAELRDLAKKGPICLLYGARDHDHNQAIVLADTLRQQAGIDI